MGLHRAKERSACSLTRRGPEELEIDAAVNELADRPAVGPRQANARTKRLPSRPD